MNEKYEINVFPLIFYRTVVIYFWFLMLIRNGLLALWFNVFHHRQSHPVNKCVCDRARVYVYSVRDDVTCDDRHQTSVSLCVCVCVC